jgi:hypothetical protein
VSKGDGAFCTVLLAGLVVAMVVCGSGPVSASCVLTEDEQTMVQGGCPLWCQILDCTGSYPATCNGTVYGICFPNTPEYACDIVIVLPHVVWRCLRGTDTGIHCTQGDDYKGCGAKLLCICTFDLLCESVLLFEYNRHYYPCETTW